MTGVPDDIFIMADGRFFFYDVIQLKAFHLIYLFAGKRRRYRGCGIIEVCFIVKLGF